MESETQSPQCNKCWDYGWMCDGACIDPENHEQRSDCKNPEDCGCAAGSGKDPLCSEVKETFVEAAIAQNEFAQLLGAFCGKDGKAYTAEERKLMDAFGKLEFRILYLSGAALRLVERVDENFSSPSQTEPS